MAWQEAAANRLALDAGSQNFRGKRCGAERATHLLSRLGWERKGGRHTAFPPRAALRDEAGESFASPFTREALTSFSAFNHLLECFLGEEGIAAEKRSAKYLSLSHTARAFEPTRIAINRLEYFFELVGFGALCPFRAGEGLAGQNGILVDLGHSQMSVAPVFAGRLLRPAFRAVEFGGKTLTKLLQESLSRTQIDLKGHFSLVNEIKEKCCFVSAQPLRAASLRVPCAEIGYTLPDYSAQRPGALVSPAVEEKGRADVVWLSNLRVTIPEIVFSPRAAGLGCAGLVEAFAEAVECVPEDIRGRLLRNVVVTGGSALFPGMEQRLFNELQAVLPSDTCLGYRFLPGGHWLLSRVEQASMDAGFAARALTKAQYDEFGSCALIDYLSL